MQDVSLLRKIGCRLREGRQRFVSNVRGATAIEFTILAIPTILLILTMIYTGLISLNVGVLDTSIEKVGYQVYEGRPICVGAGTPEFPYDAQCIKNRICEASALILVSPSRCKATARVDVRLLAENGTDNIPLMMNGTSINEAAFGTSTGVKNGRVILIRMLLPFPNFSLMASSAPSLGLAGDRVLLAATAFRIRDLTTYTRPPT